YRRIDQEWLSLKVAAEVGDRRSVEDAPARADRRLTVAEWVEGDSNARSEIPLHGWNHGARHAGIARINQPERRVREHRRPYTEAKLLIFVGPAKQLPIHFVAESEVQRHFPGNPPVVLKETEEVIGEKVAILPIVLPERIGSAEQKIG